MEASSADEIDEASAVARGKTLRAGKTRRRKRRKFPQLTFIRVDPRTKSASRLRPPVVYVSDSQDEGELEDSQP